MPTALLHYECARCGRRASDSLPATVSACCEAPLASRYDLDRARAGLPRPGSPGARGLWRYEAILPLRGSEAISLGEGGTPLLRLSRTEKRLGSSGLWLKDESANPTGSFKDRGLSVAVSLAKAAGIRGIVLPTAGNAGAAAAAYGARAGLVVSVHAPESTPPEILAEIRLRGARITEHPGSIADAGRAASAEAAATGFLSVATFREPGRVEGKKTMAYEVFEELGRVPDAIVYPCGGGTGVVAMAQAFEEMAGLGWIGSERPRLFAIQADGCAPVVRAFRRGADRTEPWPDPTTLAAGLRVPTPFADQEIIAALRHTGGGAVEVREDDIFRAGWTLARDEGVLPCPEGAAAFAGAERLLAAGTIATSDTVVVFQTGSALKYLDTWRTYVSNAVDNRASKR
jgi:threonine synthase